MSTRTIFLVGAPTFSSLQWDQDDLLSEPVPPFQNSRADDETSRLLLETRPAKWRLLSGIVVPEVSRVKEQSALAEGARFLTTYDLSMPLGMQILTHEPSELSRFYDHSFTIHETSEISAPDAHSGELAPESGLSIESTDTSIASNKEEDILTARPHIQGSVTNLQDIPNAVYLESIVPQTMTVNLIVALIAIRPARRIVTRQGRKELDLVEVVVGDETKTGFGITFWLPIMEDKSASRGRSDEAGQELRRSLMLLRVRDIVLIRTVGLSCFRERVYGQSLRQGFTKIDLLHRQRIDATDLGGVYHLRDILNRAAKNGDLPLVKVRKVHEWIRQFVPDPAGGGIQSGRKAATLPPDTQDVTL